MASEAEWLEVGLGLRPEPTGEEVWKRLVTTKARVWEYEKEWRCVTLRRSYENQGFEDATFDPREISKIFFGCRITDADKSAILTFLSGPFAHVEAYQARQHSMKYQLEFVRIK